MEKPANKQNPERNRDPLPKATEEEQRKQTGQLMAEQAAKDAPAIDSDEIYIRTNGAIRSGVIWA